MYAFWIFPLYSWTRATLCCIDLFILLMLINSIGKILLPTLFSLSFFANVLGDFLKGLSLTLPKMVKDNRTTNTSHLILLKEFYIKHSLVVDFVLRTKWSIWGYMYKILVQHDNQILYLNVVCTSTDELNNLYNCN
ncbi:hypothetical protein BLOT_009005 [Blomia tropicalis]|nr:hypothetical protein BLOT_009005 [Blomia tropicalis]